MKGLVTILLIVLILLAITLAIVLTLFGPDRIVEWFGIAGFIKGRATEVLVG